MGYLRINRRAGEGFWLEGPERSVRVEITQVSHHKALINVEAFTVIPKVCKLNQPIRIAIGVRQAVTITHRGIDFRQTAMLGIEAPADVRVLRDELRARELDEKDYLSSPPTAKNPG